MWECDTFTVQRGWVVRGRYDRGVARQGWAECTLSFCDAHDNEGEVDMAWRTDAWHVHV